MYDLISTASFERSLRRFSRAHPELRQRVARVLTDLEADPYQPHLRLHALQGGLNGLHAVSVTYRYRMTLTLRVDERTITLLDIGSHADVYR